MSRAPESFARQWTRDGADIPGATGASYVATDVGAYRCRVTATNAAGSATQTSAAKQIPSNEFSVVSVKKLPAKGKARITLELPGAGLVQLNPPAGTSAAIAANGTESREKTATEAGRLRLNVTATGAKKRKLYKTGRVKVKAAVTFTPTGGEPNTLSRKIRLKKR